MSPPPPPPPPPSPPPPPRPARRAAARRGAASAAWLLGPALAAAAALALFFSLSPGAGDYLGDWADDLTSEWRAPLTRHAGPRPALPPLPPSPSRVAVLIETRPAAKLPSVVANAAAVLPPDWRLQLFLSEAARALAAGSPGLAPLLASGRAFFSPLPAPVASSGGAGLAWADFNALLMSRALWRAVAGEHVLIFQLDTALCAASPHKIGDYLSYDYVGAPWTRERWGDAPGGNGGLSLRRRSRMLAALDALGPGSAANAAGAAGSGSSGGGGGGAVVLGGEDEFFSRTLAAMGARLPPREVARTFAVETVFYATPFGVHKFWPYMTAEQRERLFEFCPEARVAAAP
ncbi:hypothetical protein Rsub_13113 [Raphidocelis subcapitata]|uniref:DUF5672 domain-containing protein n=1 Tax=Raphidocelis subcapitata TaxID=307507 RepID=A0A2V0PJK2_9CHLO|nr:hypothetical protein Rsub_13113 [Raphidocelis subcapitata]|eukprot:GBF99981.1 hypothetical protein Rsub_13113 [Raphidocelis subcapitata]